MLVLGAGGGGEVLNALYHDSASVDAVELNPQVIELVEREHGDLAGHIYASDLAYPVRLHIAETRGFIRSTVEKYDLIQMVLPDAATPLSESYPYTVEAMAELFQHLTPDGLISITYGGLRTPPRGMIKLFAVTVEALENIDGEMPSEQLAMIRGLSTGTLLVKNGQFQPNEQAAIWDFCRQRSFDVAYYPQMPESEANRYNQLAEPIYFRAAQAILSEDRKQFYREYPFHIRPATDNCPYFFRFLRLSLLIQMVQEIGRNAIPFIEWGYPLLFTTLVQAILAGLLLILLPLFFLRHSSSLSAHQASPSSLMAHRRFPDRSQGQAYWQVFSYFLSLGIAFMFIEMAFIQKFLLLLSNPVYAVAVVLCAFLIFAGLGSLSCRRLEMVIRRVVRKPPRRRYSVTFAIGMISLMAILYPYLLPSIFHRFLASSDLLKAIVSIGLIAPLAFFMGMPFPLGIDALRQHHPNLIAWAWAINGYASVVSTILATCLAIAFGFNAVILLAIGIYLVGGWVAPH